MEETKVTPETTPVATSAAAAPAEAAKDGSKIKTRQGSGYLKQLYSTARTTAGTTHSNLKNLTTFLVNFIPVANIDASELQVRVHFEDSEIEAMAHSIKEHGVLQPILVVQDGDRYKVIAGERRLRGAKLAGLDRIPARVLSTNDKATHEIALRENLDRVDLHPIEEGEGYVSLLEAQAYTSHDSIAKAFGKPKSRITECVGFTRLPDATKQELLKVGVKNRALLRTLLTTPAEHHMAMIAEAAKKEEIIQLSQQAAAAAGGEAAVSTPLPPAKQVKPFTYVMDAKKGLAVPGFKWKKKEGPDKLKAYVEALYKLIAELEPQIKSGDSR